jgi:hypothetical protein
MKIIPLLMGACLLLAVTGCQKPSDIIGRAETSIKSAALEAITAKYPEVSLSELKFSEMRIRAMSNGQEDVFVTYAIPGSAKTTTEGKKATATTKTIGVRMLPSGKVEMVYKSTNEETYSVAQ